MICLHCKKPIMKYPAFSQYDPQWVHEQDGMPWGSEFCEGPYSEKRVTNTVATTSSVSGPRMSYRESMIDAGRGHLLRGDE